MPNILKGTVTKVGVMRKTITVTISRTFEHPKLLKPILRTKKMLVHDEAEEAQLNDRVTIIHGKPISARKRFSLLSIDQRPSASSAGTTGGSSKVMQELASASGQSNGVNDESTAS